MIAYLKKIWYAFAAAAEKERRRKEEEQAILRENIEAWNEMNKDFIRKLNREVDKECDEFCDISRVPDPDAYNFDGRPLGR